MIPTTFSDQYDKINHLHIELTNRCNAACPMCMRFHQSSPLVRPDLILNDITIDQFKSWFPPKFLKQVIQILFCGVHGDPIIARDVFEITEYILENNPKLNIQFNTNGGMRNPEWWGKFGKLLTKNPQCRVIFSVDGLEDTNHLYRRNVQWSKLMANISAFIDAGGNAHWEYLIFKHNEHQIDEAKELARKMKFKEFFPKKALGVDNGVDLHPLGVVDKTGQMEYIIEAPLNPKNRNLENPRRTGGVAINVFKIEDYKRYKESTEIQDHHKWKYTRIYETLDDALYESDNKRTIKCKSLRKNVIDIFVDNFGNVLPCCYVGTHFNSNLPYDETLQLHNEIKNYGTEKINLNYTTFDDIIKERHLDKIFTNSWTKESFSKGKMLFCSKTCGENNSIDRIYTHEGKERL